MSVRSKRCQSELALAALTCHHSKQIEVNQICVRGLLLTALSLYPWQQWAIWWMAVLYVKLCVYLFKAKGRYKQVCVKDRKSMRETARERESQCAFQVLCVSGRLGLKLKLVNYHLTSVRSIPFEIKWIPEVRTMTSLCVLSPYTWHWVRSDIVMLPFQPIVTKDWITTESSCSGFLPWLWTDGRCICTIWWMVLFWEYSGSSSCSF